MGVNSVLTNIGVASDSVREELVRLKESIELKLLQRFERAKAEGDLSPDCDPRSLMLFVMTLANGMAIQASSGVKREALNKVVQAALAGWPRRLEAVA